MYTCMMYVVYTQSVVGVARCYAIKSLRCSHRRSFPRAGVIFDEPPPDTGSGRVRINRDRSAIRVPSLSRDETSRVYIFLPRAFRADANDIGESSPCAPASVR